MKLVLVPRKEDGPRGQNSVGNYYSMEYYHPQNEQALDYREGYNNEVLMRICGDTLNGPWIGNTTAMLEKAAADNGDIDSARPIDLGSGELLRPGGGGKY